MFLSHLRSVSLCDRVPLEPFLVNGAMFAMGVDFKYFLKPQANFQAVNSLVSQTKIDKDCV